MSPLHFVCGWIRLSKSAAWMAQIEHWDRRLILWAEGVRIRVFLVHRGCWAVASWATGHFAGVAFRHTLIVEADATESTWDSGNG